MKLQRSNGSLVFARRHAIAQTDPFSVENDNTVTDNLKNQTNLKAAVCLFKELNFIWNVQSAMLHSFLYRKEKLYNII